MPLFSLTKYFLLAHLSVFLTKQYFNVLFLFLSHKKNESVLMHIFKKKLEMIMYKHMGYIQQMVADCLLDFGKKKLFLKNGRKKIHYNISEITQKSQKSTSKITLFFFG